MGNLEQAGPNSSQESAAEAVAALVALGLSETEARAAVEEDRVALALVDRISTHENRPLTLDDLEDGSGLAGWAYRLWERALGVPPRTRFGERDVETARALKEAVDVLPVEELEQMIRGLRGDAHMLTRMAMSDLQLVHDRFVTPVRAQGGGEVAVALALAEAARMLLPIAATLVGGAYERVLAELLSGQFVASAARGGGELVELAVGFVDVTGFTSLSARIDPAGLERVLEAFETRCYAIAGTHSSLQLVKFLGDAGMFVATDAVALVGALLEGVEPVDDGPLADAAMRAGMAAGAVLPRGGDYFGGPVNLAARLTDRARPGTVLAAEHLAPVLAEDFDTRRLAPVRLRGIGTHRPVRIRHRAD